MKRRKVKLTRLVGKQFIGWVIGLVALCGLMLISGSALIDRGHPAEAAVQSLIHYDKDGAPAEDHAWRPDGQLNVLNPIGGSDLSGQLTTEGIKTLKLTDKGFADQTLLKYGQSNCDDKTGQAYEISKYATQTKVPGRYNVTLTAKGNETTATISKPLEVVFVVDLSGSMEQIDGKTPSSKYLYQDEQSHLTYARSIKKYTVNGEHQPLFDNDIVTGHPGKYAQYGILSDYGVGGDLQSYRFQGQDGTWYAFNKNNEFVKVPNLTGPTLNKAYPDNTRAKYVRDGIRETLAEIKKFSGKNQTDSAVSVGLVGFSSGNSISNDVAVPLKPYSDDQAAAINQALDPDFTGATWTQSGLRRGANMLHEEGDAHANKIIILLTDGRPDIAGNNGEIGNGSDENDDVWNATKMIAHLIKAQIHIQGISINTPPEDEADFRQLTSINPKTGEPDYIPVGSDQEIKDALIRDARYDLNEVTTDQTISNGVITDPLGGRYQYLPASQSPPVVTGTGLADAQIQAVATQLQNQLQPGSRQLKIDKLTLGKGQSLTFTYQVQLETEADDWKPDHWYPMNGPTTLTPDAKTPPVDFGIPSGKVPATKLEITKEWQDRGEKQRPKQITVTVTRDHKLTNGETKPTDWQATGELTADKQWKQSFSELTRSDHSVSLPKYDNEGHEFVYRVSGEAQDQKLAEDGYLLAEQEVNQKDDQENIRIVNKQYLLNVKKLAQGADFKDTALKGAEFTLTDKQNEKQLLTDDKPYVGLQPGHYQLQETKAPPGYKLDSTSFGFTVADNGTVKPDAGDLKALPTEGTAKDGFYLANTEGAQVVTFVKTDTVVAKRLILNKVDADTHKPLAGAQFETSEGKLAADESGKHFTSDQIGPDKVYKITEVEAPAGYIRLAKPLTLTTSKTGDVQIALGNERPKTLPKAGTEVDLGAGIVAKMGTGDQSDEIQVTVGNRHKGMLPNTGSATLLRLLVISVALIGLALVLAKVASQQRRKEDRS